MSYQIFFLEGRMRSQPLLTETKVQLQICFEEISALSPVAVGEKSPVHCSGLGKSDWMFLNMLLS